MDTLLSFLKNLDEKSFYLEESGKKYFKEDVHKLVSKVKKDFQSVANFENKKVFLDIKDRKLFIIVFFSLLELNAKPVLIPPEIKIIDYFYPDGIFISDNKFHDEIINVNSDFSISLGVNFNPENKQNEAADEDKAIYLYTSGSTGKPKLIPKSNKNLISEIGELKKILDVSSESVFYFTAPICHIYGFLNGFLLPLYSSAKIILDPKFTPQDVAGFVNQKRITHLVSIPSYYRMFLEMNLISMFNNCQSLISSSAPLPLDVSKVFYENGVRITEIYGSTETGGIAHRVSAENIEWKLYSYVKIISDWAEYTDIEEEKVNELKIDSPAISVDYDSNSGFNTGDVVCFSDNGNFKLLGRNTRFVKISGKRVDLHSVLEKIIKYLNEIDGYFIKEEELYIDQKDGKIYLISEKELPKKHKEIKDDLKHLLPSYAVPRLFIISKISRNNMGKIKKTEIDKIIGNK